MATEPPARRGVPLLTTLAGYLARFCLRILASVRVEGVRDLPRDGGADRRRQSHLERRSAVRRRLADTGAWAARCTSWPRRRCSSVRWRTCFGALGASPVRAGGSDIEAYRMAQGILERGEVLCIFPEGTRSATGVMGEPKPGVAMLALRTGVPDPARRRLQHGYVPWSRPAPAAAAHANHAPGRAAVHRYRRPGAVTPRGDQRGIGRDHAPHRRADRRAPSRPLRRWTLDIVRSR